MPAPQIDLENFKDLDRSHTQSIGLDNDCNDSEIVEALWIIHLKTRSPGGNTKLDKTWIEPASLPKMNGRFVSLSYSWSPGDPGVRSSAIETVFVDEECQAVFVNLEFLD